MESSKLSPIEKIHGLNNMVAIINGDQRLIEGMIAKNKAENKVTKLKKEYPRGVVLQDSDGDIIYYPSGYNDDLGEKFKTSLRTSLTLRDYPPFKVKQ